MLSVFVAGKENAVIYSGFVKIDVTICTGEVVFQNLLWFADKIVSSPHLKCFSTRHHTAVCKWAITKQEDFVKHKDNL